MKESLASSAWPSARLTCLARSPGVAALSTAFVHSGSVSSFLCFHFIVGQGGQDPLPPALLMLLPRRGDSRRGTD